ncbi:hypothetical protein CC78DRAFT_483146, partial [Lojkania enalia]
IDLSYISTQNQPADGLTKILPRQRHQNWVSLLHLNEFPSNGQEVLSTLFPTGF